MLSFGRVSPSLTHARAKSNALAAHRYYDRIFPANLMCRWLSYGTQHAADPARKLLNRREFSFTTGDDIYIRYLSFEDAAGLKKELLQKLPHKIDIGAVFSAAPRDHKKFKLFEAGFGSRMDGQKNGKVLGNFPKTACQPFDDLPGINVLGPVQGAKGILFFFQVETIKDGAL